MRSRRWSAVFCWVIFTAHVFAQTQPTRLPATLPVDQLIKQLSADDWRARQAAQTQLTEIGADALDALRATTQQSVDDETRSRIESALAEISDNQVSGTSYITLHMSDQPPSAVFAELSKQCGTTLEPITPEMWQQRPLPPISIDVDRQPFWTVMRELSAKTNVVLQPWENGQRLSIAMSAPHGPQVVSGAFQITADSVRRSQMINLAAGTTPMDDFGVVLSVSAEPKIRLGRTWSEVQMTAAVDDHGNSLLGPALPNRGGGYSNGAMGSWSVQVPLRYPQNNPGTKLARLAGSLRAEIKTQIQSIEFDDVMTAQNVRKTLRGHSLTLVSTEKQGVEYVLHLSGDVENPVRGDFNENDWSPQNFTLEDANGRLMVVRGVSQQQVNNRRELELRFSPGVQAGIRLRGRPSEAAPTHLKWTIAMSSKTVPIPFEFKDLPMP